jgi:hypothetical protein
MIGTYAASVVNGDVQRDSFAADGSWLRGYPSTHLLGIHGGQPSARAVGPFDPFGRSPPSKGGRGDTAAHDNLGKQQRDPGGPRPPLWSGRLRE